MYNYYIIYAVKVLSITTNVLTIILLYYTLTYMVKYCYIITIMLLSNCILYNSKYLVVCMSIDVV